MSLQTIRNKAAALKAEWDKGDARDFTKISALLSDLSKGFDAGDENAGGYEGGPELKALCEQLRKDVDKNAEELRVLRKSGLAREGHRIQVLNYDEIVALRKTRRVFRFKDQAEQFGAMMAKTLLGGHPAYKERVALRTREMADALTKDLAPDIPLHGQELIANLYMADLIAHVEAVGVLFTQCDRVPLQTLGSTTWPKLTGELTARPAAASAKVPEGSPTFSTVSMTPVKWMTDTPIPNEFFRNPTLLDALGQRVAWLITRAVAYAADNVMVNGDGTADYGTVTGMFNDNNITAVTPAAATAIGSYTGTDVGNIIAGVTKDYVTDPYFGMSLSVERTLRNIRSTIGTPLYDRGSNGEPNTIDNYPYVICQRFPAAANVATASKKWGFFGQLDLAYFFGMLGGVEIASSEHVRFENDMTVVRGLVHMDAALMDANALVVAETHS